ncbi:ISAzo13-like element transposase-related protein [Trichormus azollae]|uniref:ISAzo13-like element transposase-related protein n=1 Tax=Trichormus azollae TaxID=1164 RepID=UPI003D3538BA
MANLCYWSCYSSQIPHRLYDIRDNVGYIQISTTHHTSELACDSIPYWWNTYHKVPHYGANSILL